VLADYQEKRTDEGADSAIVKTTITIRNVRYPSGLLRKEKAMKIGEGSVSSAKQIINDVVTMIRYYNCLGVDISKSLSAADLTVFIPDESGCREIGNESMTEFRGYAKETRIIICFTRYETTESVKWLLLHEIGHWVLMHNQDSAAFMNISRQQHYKNVGICKGVNTIYNAEPGFHKEYMKDAVHDADPEEHISNLFATAILGEDLGRPWWRANIEKVKAQSSNSRSALESCIQ
jgi:hypothetical protein